ncbi:MAG: ethylbenzene dehydrogenase-related protein [Alphaproteobacteria bacterium]|jgi:DMSO reductase family type II enzyme heme b subunit|uniref:Putative cytochrome C n=1 Tax=uncultured Pseudomonadota bacterium TaxID=153809 RepID=A0A2P0QJE2_9PROT|nr:putative cytochrome C [uncultured proteobacterium]MDP6013492.1 ethylbenzene dehydrogenase-related protein [Alphaproteobacteria bacterium]MDP7234569.1 ethylbenzene dehydrogenase-related protein [Alphaproteobacteria bacterium]MEE1543821.1 ethylbenzene dehydrogenase-related protein [Alphaproteobacteria bacterium]
MTWLQAMTVGAVALLAALPAVAADTPSAPMPEVTEEFVEQGRAIYIRRCSFCHGLMGDGEGPAAQFLDPRPRDFTLGTFKFRTTQSGELPTDEDLFRTVSRGLSGTGMQAFDSGLIKSGLSEEERWQVIAYIKTFAFEFDDPELDPIATGKLVSLPANLAAYNAETIAKGQEIFERAKCWECHGKQGRGNGQKAFDRKDDWGFPIRIRNVTLPWKLKGGARVEDIYMRFSTGINGTPMPSFAKALNDEERWYLANFIKSLQHQATDAQVLAALSIEGEVPSTPNDPAWEAASAIDLRLAGQVIVAPRWQNPSIELVSIRAINNDKEIAFLLEWDDPFEDRLHDVEAEFDASEISQPGAFNSYVPAIDTIPRKLETFRDSVALQFPVRAPEGTAKPHFLRGGASTPVNLWTWLADRSGEGERVVEESLVRGWGQAPKPQAEDEQQITGSAGWAEGRWQVVMRRPLLTDDKNDVQFARGQFIPMAINAWDGSNGEHGLIMSLSSWYFVVLESPIPISVYLFAVLAVLITGALGYWLMRKVERETSAQPQTVESGK